jgi:hypothetical protein
MFSELSEIFNGLSGNPEEINCTLNKMVKTIHNTMSDRGPTNKPYALNCWGLSAVSLPPTCNKLQAERINL